jgi:GAF domain-containing protein
MADDLRAAVAAGVVGSQDAHQELLQSVAEVARAIFAARAASIFLLDEDTDELVFETVAGHGETSLVGNRFPSGRGIAGWVLTTRQPIAIEDPASDKRFAADVAASTGYTPAKLLACPLLSGERSVGVIEVIDPPASRRVSAADLDMLGLFANQAAIALDLMLRNRRAAAAVAGGGDDATAIAALAAAVDRLDGPRRDAAERLVGALAELLDQR